MNKRKIGIDGELMALEYLIKKGYKILDQNYRCFIGEIDIICAKEGMIIFVEVKTRQSSKYGTAKEAVNYRKQQKIIKIAQIYLQNTKKLSQPRFDVIEVYPGKIPGQETKLVHIMGAF